MLEVILVTLNLWWFYNTKYFKLWSKIKIGDDQFSISITALIILIYIAIGAFGFVRGTIIIEDSNNIILSTELNSKNIGTATVTLLSL